MTETPDFTDKATLIWQFIKSAPEGRSEQAIAMIRAYLGIVYWTGREEMAREELERLSKPASTIFTVTSRMP
jgi:hypothetical protein